MRILSLVIVLVPLTVHAEEPAKAVAKAKQAFEARKYDEALKALDAVIAKDPKYAGAYQIRGCTRYMKGDFEAACADFDKFIALNPKAFNGNWQRGIALYYVGRYADGRDQFQGYEKVADNDVENTFWHFMCVYRKEGAKKAHASLLKTRPDARTPMNEVLQLIQGKVKPEAVLKAANAVPKEKRKRALFYGHLYLGLYADVIGDKKKALEHLKKAAGEYHNGSYMGEVARVHRDWLGKKK